MRFAKLSEDNEWEGEKWYFYVRVDDLDNVDEVAHALEQAAQKMNGEQDGYPYQYEGTVDLTPEQCDVLANLESGYMDYHNFIHKFDLQKFVSAVDDCDDDNDVLYKGGLMDYGESMYAVVEVKVLE